MSTHEHYTHGYSEAVLSSHARRTVENSFGYGRHLLQPGLRILDLGCGPGTITVELAHSVAPGEVVGVDIDATVLDRARAHGDGLANLTFVEAEATSLGFADDTFDLSHAHQVLQHLGDPVAALRELARVTRPGGTIAVRDADYGAFSWYPEVPGLDRWRYLYRCVPPSAVVGSRRRPGARRSPLVHLDLQRSRRDGCLVGTLLGAAGERPRLRGARSQPESGHPR